MLEEALWSPARRKIIFRKTSSENRKAAHWAALFKEAKGEGKNLSGKAMQECSPDCDRQSEEVYKLGRGLKSYCFYGLLCLLIK